MWEMNSVCSLKVLNSAAERVISSLLLTNVEQKQYSYLLPLVVDCHCCLHALTKKGLMKMVVVELWRDRLESHLTSLSSSPEEALLLIQLFCFHRI